MATASGIAVSDECKLKFSELKAKRDHRATKQARVRSKMLYASSKDRFRRELDGVQVELQATDASEMSLDTFVGRAR
ncbi:hypothetical protein HAX54_040138 [Datura stramonium]|uniref:ADF-H domain-containing protein n=1 Tax=Datura stramonium TaxID=4076 RepID=A0ABS8SJM4_DATST|nr:hypothetical protein [Datura stramonium]